MKKNAFIKKFSVALSVSILMTILCPALSLNSFAFGATGATSTTSIASSDVYSMPLVSTINDIGSIGIESVKVFWKEGSFYYIQYSTSSGSKRGYVPSTAISAGVAGAYSYNKWTSHTTSNQTVYDLPNNTTPYVIGTVYSTDTFTVFGEDGGWYLIEYPVSGGHKRGYVPTSTVVAGSHSAAFSNGIYCIKNVNSDLYLDVLDEDTASDTNVVQANYHTYTAEQWKIEMHSDGYYEITPMNSTGTRLDLHGAVDANGTNVQIHTNNESDAQRWMIVSNGDGSYRIVSKCSNSRVIDIENASTSNGANAHYWQYNGGSNQKWIFEACTTDYSILGLPCIAFSTNSYSLTYGYIQDGSKDWTNGITLGMSAWNSSLAHVFFIKNSGNYPQTNIVLESDDFGSSGWDACETGPFPWLLDTATISLNDYYSDGFNNAAELVAHETGHALKLGDYDPNFGTLMRSSGYNGTPNPTPSDTTGVNTTY